MQPTLFYFSYVTVDCGPYFIGYLFSFLYVLFICNAREKIITGREQEHAQAADGEIGRIILPAETALSPRKIRTKLVETARRAKSANASRYTPRD